MCRMCGKASTATVREHPTVPQNLNEHVAAFAADRPEPNGKTSEQRRGLLGHA